MAHHTMRTSRLLPLLISFLLAGCAELVPEVAGPPQTRVFELDRHPTRHLRIRTEVHPDHLGWTLAIEQATAVTTAVQTETSQHYRRYVFSPLSIVPGLFQCPYGMIKYVLTLGHASDEPMPYGCRRLLMREPLQGSILLPSNIHRTLELTERWEPVKGGWIDVKWAGQTDLLATYPTPAMRTVLRLAHLLRNDQARATSQEAHTGRLEVNYRQGPHTITTMLDVSPKQLTKAYQAATHSIPAERWPHPLVVQVAKLQGFPTVLEEVIEASLAKHFLQAQICFVADDPTKSRIIEEQQFQLSGRVHDSQQVALGRWIPATVLITGNIDTTQTAAEVVLQVSSIPSGEVLGTIRLPVTPTTAFPMASMLSEDLRLITAQAPKTPCGSFP
ncbi:conserved exported hypothetical protein [Nitrospira defluvii]|uniref:FlgO domain-containing protein n=3 Tax=Nitrospira TaxID=1234 RepID=A0AA86T427_9BACT|nr:conserved exported hypothetical protein [Nitrospira defluvii]CAI4031665.1 hypothetical protein DNFV4_02084 [Nitrospira tepida]